MSYSVKQLLEAVANWSDDMLHKRFRTDKRGWKALRSNRPDLKSRMDSVESSYNKPVHKEPKHEDWKKVDMYDHSRGMEVIGDYPDSHDVDDWPGIEKAAHRHNISLEDAKKGLDHISKKRGFKDYYSHLKSAKKEFMADRAA